MSNEIRFLLVDDRSTMRHSVKDVSNDLGYANAAEGDDGNTAPPMLKSEAFDDLIKGWNISGTADLERLKAARTDTRLANLPLVMHAAERKRGPIVEVAHAGVSGHVGSPFAPGAQSAGLADCVTARFAVK
jgi:two-component system chemotaxis response regulator CheY